MLTTLFDSSDLVHEIFTSIEQHFMHALTGVPVAKSVVSMLSCSITCVSCTLLLSSVSTTIFQTVYAWYQLKCYTTTSKPHLHNKKFVRQ